MDYKKLYEQSQEIVQELEQKIARLKANDEESMELAMEQNERFMDQLAEKDAEIENLKKEVVDERKKTANMEDCLKVRDIVREIERDYCNDNSPKRIYHSDDNDFPVALHWIHHLRREIIAAVEYHGLDESVMQDVIDAELPYADIETEIEMILQKRDDYDEMDDMMWDHDDEDIITGDCVYILEECVERNLPVGRVRMIDQQENVQYPFNDDMLNPTMW
jgi:1-deoxy-D-xylulose 5-phosphate reductoisomerase